MRIDTEEAIQKIQAGEVVGLPTDTVYGLAAEFENAKKIFQIKQRPLDRPCLILAADREQVVALLSDIPEGFDELCEQWPGPLSLVMPTDRVPAEIRAGQPSAGFRIPNHPLALEVLRATGPLAVSSANLSDDPPATDADGVERIFGKNFPVVDGGRSSLGRPSRILAYRDGAWHTLRS